MPFFWQDGCKIFTEDKEETESNFKQEVRIKSLYFVIKVSMVSLQPVYLPTGSIFQRRIKFLA